MSKRKRTGQVTIAAGLCLAAGAWNATAWASGLPTKHASLLCGTLLSEGEPEARRAQFIEVFFEIVDGANPSIRTLRALEASPLLGELTAQDTQESVFIEAIQEWRELAATGLDLAEQRNLAGTLTEGLKSRGEQRGVEVARGRATRAKLASLQPVPIQPKPVYRPYDGELTDRIPFALSESGRYSLGLVPGRNEHDVIVELRDHASTGAAHPLRLKAPKKYEFRGPTRSYQSFAITEAAGGWIASNVERENGSKDTQGLGFWRIGNPQMKFFIPLEEEIYEEATLTFSPDGHYLSIRDLSITDSEEQFVDVRKKTIKLLSRIGSPPFFSPTSTHFIHENRRFRIEKDIAILEYALDAKTPLSSAYILPPAFVDSVLHGPVYLERTKEFLSTYWNPRTKRLELELIRPEGDQMRRDPIASIAAKRPVEFSSPDWRIITSPSSRWVWIYVPTKDQSIETFVLDLDRKSLHRMKKITQDAISAQAPAGGWLIRLEEGRRLTVWSPRTGQLVATSTPLAEEVLGVARQFRFYFGGKNVFLAGGSGAAIQIQLNWKAIEELDDNLDDGDGGASDLINAPG